MRGQEGVSRLQGKLKTSCREELAETMKRVSPTCSPACIPASQRLSLRVMPPLVSCLAVNRCESSATGACLRASRSSSLWMTLGLLLATTMLCGCGTTKLQNATEQLVLSDAVDRSVGQIDFRPLAGRRVYFDTTYLKTVKNDSFVNADYVISAMRQQIIAAGCYIEETISDADLVIEGRIGTLGMDDHRLTYGVPENNSLSSTASLISTAPRIPSIPEIAFARRESREGAAKVAAFAYDRETRQAVWQSGLSRANSTARDTWVLGVGPFRQGTIRRELKFADARFGFRRKPPPSTMAWKDGEPPIDYSKEMVFPSAETLESDAATGSMLAESEQPAGAAKPGAAEPSASESEASVAALPDSTQRK